jgi:multiple sugar transport system permease protein
MAKRRKKFKSAIVPYAFLLPFLTIFVVFLVAPLLYAFDLSLFRESLIGPTRFVGAANFWRVVEDPDFWSGVVNTLEYATFLIPTLLSITLVLALIIDSDLPRGAALFRIVYFIPYAVPSVIATLIWGYLYGPMFGPITQLAHMIGLPPPAILSDRWMLFALANIVIWELIGYKMIIVYTAMKNVPIELQEAADLDGASFLQYAIRVKIPLVIGAIMLNAIFSIIGSLQLFNEPALIKKIAPSVINDSYTPNLYAYTLAFNAQDLPYAAAVSFVLAALVALVSSIVVLLQRGRRA